MTTIDKTGALDQAGYEMAPGRLRSWTAALCSGWQRGRENRKLREMPRERLADMGIDPAAVGAPQQGHDFRDLPGVLIPGRIW